jgi:hypothetical protein
MGAAESMQFAGEQNLIISLEALFLQEADQENEFLDSMHCSFHGRVSLTPNSKTER